MPIFFNEKTDKTQRSSKFAIFVWYENGRQQLPGVQSISTESFFKNFMPMSKIGQNFCSDSKVSSQNHTLLQRYMYLHPQGKYFYDKE